MISCVWPVEQAGGGKCWNKVFNLMKEKFVILHYIFPFMSIKIQAFFYLIKEKPKFMQPFPCSLESNRSGGRWLFGGKYIYS